MKKLIFSFAIGMGISLLFSSCSNNMMIADTSVSVKSASTEDFTASLPVPVAFNGKGSLIAQVTTSTIFNGKSSGVLGYQAGSILGPTIDVKSGDNIGIDFQNHLSKPSNIHWHGLVIPANMDGHPQDVVKPGEGKNYNFTVNQRAGMYWYHPHPDGYTAEQAYLGLAGLFIVRDAEEISLKLPSGEFELPLVIQDKRFSSNLSLDYSPNMNDIMTGYLGSNVLVNGVNSPFREVKTHNYRLRVLNGSNARIYNLALSNNASFTVIGSDGGLLAAPQKTTSLLLGPGERTDLIVDFSTYPAGTDLYLVSNKFSAGNSQGNQNFQIMKFRVIQGEKDSFTIPASLSTITALAKSNGVKIRTFDISGGMGNRMSGTGNMMGGMGSSGMSMKGMHRINNKVYDPSRIDETIQAGTTEIWVFDNSAGNEPHPMHLHAAQFQVLNRTGGRNGLIASETGWKDTVLLLPGEKVRVIINFGQNKGKYVLHCHNLEHEDSGMMLQFEII